MRSGNVVRFVVGLLILAAIVVGAILLVRYVHAEGIGDQAGVRRWLRAHQQVREWVHSHRIIAPLALVGLYLLLSLLMLPVWWIQVLAGHFWGVIWGTILCQGAASLGALGTSLLAKWVLGEWFHRRIEARASTLKKLDKKLGHNGFLVVLLTRLAHIIPFGPSNYAMGLIPIAPAAVFFGTLLGGIPTVAFYTACGHGSVTDGITLAIIAALNLAMLAPAILWHRLQKSRAAQEDFECPRR